MPITFHPHPGTILLCDFSGLVAPEMVKKRPVIVVSPRLRRQTRLCLVVPLSTTPPPIIFDWHCRLEFTKPLSPKWPERTVWAKCDMLYSMRYERLDHFYYKNSNYSNYNTHLSEEQRAKIRACIRAYIAI